MKKCKIIIMILTISLISSLFSFNYVRGEQVDDNGITGIYRGYYTNNTGKMDMYLTINEVDNNGEINLAVFSFSPSSGNFAGKSGTYLMTGTYDRSTGNIKLNGSMWLDRPTTYIFKNLDGYFSNGVISGNDFRLERGNTINKDVINGSWKGWYTNSSGKMNLSIYINDIDEMGFITEGSFEFSPYEGNQKGKSGSYLIKGFYNVYTNEILLFGTEWIDKPSDYVFMNLRGRLNNNYVSGDCSTTSQFSLGYQFLLNKQSSGHIPTKLQSLAFAQISYNNKFPNITASSKDFTYPKYNVEYILDDNIISKSKNGNDKLWPDMGSAKWMDFYEYTEIVGWKVVNPVSIGSFAAVSFISPDNENLVIAYRGTDDFSFDGVQDYVTDGNLIFQHLNDTFIQDAQKYYIETKARYEYYSNKNKRTITLTGHSLGGALASYVAMMNGVQGDTFSAPSVTKATFMHVSKNYSESFDKAFKGVDMPYFEEISSYGDTHIAQLNEDWDKGSVIDSTILINGNPTYLPDMHNPQAMLKGALVNGRWTFDFLDTRKVVSFNNIYSFQVPKGDMVSSIDYSSIFGTTRSDEIDLKHYFKLPSRMIVYSGIGDDAITASTNSDEMHGGFGNDTYKLIGGMGSDTIIDVGGNDVLVFDNNVNRDSIKLDTKSDKNYIIIKYKERNNLFESVVKLHKVYAVEKVQFGNDIKDQYSINDLINNKLEIRETNKPTIDDLLGGTNNELWIKYSDGRSELLVASDSKTHICGINNPQFSLDNKKVYFQSVAYMTSNNVFVVDIKTKKVRLVCAGNDMKVIKNGKYKGHIVVSKHEYLEEGGSTDNYYVVDDNGNKLYELSNDDYKYYYK